MKRIFLFFCACFVALFCLPASVWATCGITHSIKALDGDCKVIDGKISPTGSLRISITEKVCCSAPGGPSSCNEKNPPEQIQSSLLFLHNLTTQENYQGSFVKEAACDGTIFRFDGVLPADVEAYILVSRDGKAGNGIGSVKFGSKEAGVGCQTLPGDRVPSFGWLLWCCACIVLFRRRSLSC